MNDGQRYSKRQPSCCMTSPELLVGQIATQADAECKTTYSIFGRLSNVRLSSSQWYPKVHHFLIDQDGNIKYCLLTGTTTPMTYIPSTLRY